MSYYHRFYPDEIKHFCKKHYNCAVVHYLNRYRHDSLHNNSDTRCTVLVHRVSEFCDMTPEVYPLSSDDNHTLAYKKCMLQLSSSAYTVYAEVYAHTFAYKTSVCDCHSWSSANGYFTISEITHSQHNYQFNECNDQHTPVVTSVVRLAQKYQMNKSNEMHCHYVFIALLITLQSVDLVNAHAAIYDPVGLWIAHFTQYQFSANNLCQLSNEVSNIHEFINALRKHCSIVS